MSRDPIGYEGGVNLYQYVENNPVGYVDPEGESPFKLIGPAAKGAKVLFRKGKQVWDDLDFDGPSKGFTKHRDGRICGIRYKKRLNLIRLDFQKYKQTHKGQYLHLHIGNDPKGQHIPIDPRLFFE